MLIGSKVRAGIASAALAVAVVGGVAVASSGSGDRPSLEQTTVGAEVEQTVETTTTVAVVETTVPVETSAVPETTAPPATTAAPSTTVPEVQMVTVPPVGTLHGPNAEAMLRDLGLVVQVEYVDAPASENEQAIGTSPSTGASVEVGSTVKLTVGRYNG